jgi:hypothetical protein
MILYHDTQSMSCHMHLKEFLAKMNGFHEDLSWMLSDIEAFNFPLTYQQDKPLIISSRKLDKISSEFPDCQIIWGVLSGFKIPADQINLELCPISSDPKVWSPDYSIQHYQAVCEIVAWDSSATFFRSLIPEQMIDFHNAFPEALTIEEFNKKNNKSS